MLRFFVRGNPLTDAAKGLAKGSFLLGLLLIGFGMLVYLLKDIFAFIAIVLFFMAGFSAIGYAVRLFILQYKMKKSDSTYRQNVEIHYEDRPF
jgi:ABC-type uncharacterized transport system fused permease/ATPase subunit